MCVCVCVCEKFGVFSVNTTLRVIRIDFQCVKKSAISDIRVTWQVVTVEEKCISGYEAVSIGKEYYLQ
jgi:hypothetical protein